MAQLTWGFVKRLLGESLLSSSGTEERWPAVESVSSAAAAETSSTSSTSSSKQMLLLQNRFQAFSWSAKKLPYSALICPLIQWHMVNFYITAWVDDCLGRWVLDTFYLWPSEVESLGLCQIKAPNLSVKGWKAPIWGMPVSFHAQVILLVPWLAL